jgi:hypothetical protein
MTTARIKAAEIAWPIVIDSSNNTIEYVLAINNVFQTYIITLTPGTYWAHKLKVGLPDCFATHVANRIQAATGQATTAQRALQGSYGAPALRFVHSNPNVTAAAIIVLAPTSTTVPIELFGWYTDDSSLNAWSENIPGGSFMVVDGAYSNAFRNTRIVEWRPRPESDVAYGHASPNATRNASDIRSMVEFEASGVSGPFVRGELFVHGPSLQNAFPAPSVDLADSAGCSLDDLWTYDGEDLRYVVHLDNVDSERVWWAPCSIVDNIDDLRKWSGDEEGYAGEYYRVRLKLRLKSDMIRQP